MPQLGVSISEGTLVTWRKQVGDEVAYEETICDIATDKIDFECPSPAAGVVAELLVEPDQTVPVGTALARISTSGGAAVAAGSGSVESQAEALQAEIPGDPPTPPAPEAGPPPQPPVIEQSGAAFVSPVVRRIAAEHGIDPGSVEGSGRRGRVTKRDILRALREREAASAAAEPPMHIESPYREEPPVARNGHGGAHVPPAAAPAAETGPGAPPPSPATAAAAAQQSEPAPAVEPGEPAPAAEQ